MSENIGKIIGVNGNLLKVEFNQPVIQNEVAYACVGNGDLKLKAEVIRIRGNSAELQVFEDTVGLKIGDPVEFTGDLLSVELGPGLLTQVFDGLQNPLPLPGVWQDPAGPEFCPPAGRAPHIPGILPPGHT